MLDHYNDASGRCQPPKSTASYPAQNGMAIGSPHVRVCACVAPVEEGWGSYGKGGGLGVGVPTKELPPPDKGWFLGKWEGRLPLPFTCTSRLD